MSKLNITFTPEFKREFKRLAKKYVSLETDMRKLIADLKVNPERGGALGKGTYKIRMAISSKNKGKSGGARVITCFMVAVLEDESDELYLLSIYDKSAQANISDQKLSTLIERVISEK